MNRITILGAALLSLLTSCGTGQTQETLTQAENEVIKTIMARRSIRKYEAKDIEDEKLQQIIRCGINAPNGMARESWEVRIVRQGPVMELADSLYSVYMNKVRGTEGIAYKAAFGAPVLVFIAYDERYDMSVVDCGLLGANMILSAQSMDLGTCCLGGIVRFINSEEGKPVLEKLGFPATHKLLYAISVGYPAESPEAKPRNEAKVKIIR